MKYKEAEYLKPKFKSLIGKPTNDSVIKNIIVSYIDKSVAKEHHRLLLMDVADKQVPAYENDYTLWAVLEDDSFQLVRDIIVNDSVEEFYNEMKLLP